MTYSHTRDETSVDTGPASERPGLRQRIASWSEGAQVIRLLTELDRLRFFEHLAAETDLRRLADLFDVSTEKLMPLVEILEAVGVVSSIPSGLVLTDDALGLVRDTEGVTLTEVLEIAAADAADFSDPLDEPDPAVEANRALSTAVAFGPRPSASLLHRFQRVWEGEPELQERLSRGGPLLDVGCGLGAHLLSAAMTFPRLRAVGVEIDPVIAEEASRRVGRLGVDERVTISAIDATLMSFRDEFEVAFWAQPFFPERSRSGVLEAVRRALRPSGLLIVQELFAPATGRIPDLKWLLDRHRYERRGIWFARPAEELALELEAAGFVDVRISETSAGRLVSARRP